MSDPTIGRTEQEQIERGYPFIVRRNAQPIPPAAIDAQPAACALINLEWLAHIAGAIEALNQPDAWQGTEEEIYNAQQQLEALANAFSTICDMAGGATLQFRQTDCTLEVSEDSGATWTQIFNAGCAKTIVTYNPDTGSIEADGQTVVDGDTIVNNTIIIDSTDNLQGDGLNKRCDTASYFADLMLPTLMQEYINTKQASANAVDIVSALIGFGIAVAGVIVTGGGAAIAYIFGGLAIATAGSDLAAKILNIDPIALNAEMTPQFWQDVKCAIYCVLPNDGIVTQDVAQDIADNLESELLTTYPNGIPLLSDSFRNFSLEALNRFSVFGALYDGSNCDLCNCNFWTHHLQKSYNDNYWYAEKYTTLVDNTEHWPRGDEGGFIDGTPTLNDDKVEVILDLSKTTAFLTSVFTTGVAYRTSSDGDSGTKYMYLYAWDEINKDWLQIGSTTMSTIGGQRSINLDPLPFPTTKLKLQVNGWGEKSPDSWWSRTQIVRFLAYGYGENVLLNEYNEWKAAL